MMRIRQNPVRIPGAIGASVPPTSTHIDEEGVLIDNFFLVRKGELQLDAVRDLLADAKFPARNPEQNIADLKGQLAANQQGIRQLEKANDRYGLSLVQKYLGFVRKNAATSVQKCR